MRLALVLGFNLVLSILLLSLAAWLWQGRQYWRSIATELELTIPEIRLTLQTTTRRCQEQRLALIQTRYQYLRLQQYGQQLQQLLQLISFTSWLSKRLLFKP